MTQKPQKPKNNIPKRATVTAIVTFTIVMLVAILAATIIGILVAVYRVWGENAMWATLVTSLVIGVVFSGTYSILYNPHGGSRKYKERDWVEID